MYFRLLKERQRAKEEVLGELKEVLKDVRERRVSGEHGSMDGSGLGSRLRDMCREAFIAAVASAKHEWVKVSDTITFQKSFVTFLLLLFYLSGFINTNVMPIVMLKRL